MTAGNEVVFLGALGSERVAPRASELPGELPLARLRS